MASLYRRADSPYIWFQWRAADGREVKRATKFRKDVEAEVREALRALAIIEQQEENIRRTGEQAPLTVRRWAERWLNDREERKVLSAKDDRARLHLHVLPKLGEMLLADVRPRHVRELFREIEKRMKRGELAPRTVLNIYGALRTMFEDAAVEEIIPGNPCRLRRARGELPEREDKDPTWRDTAIFTREEVEVLISDERIPLYRRVLYAMMFLGGGQRSGEASARRWRDWDREARPLGVLTVAVSWNSKHQLLKATKAKRTRYVPVHPVLARVLADWRLRGWAAEFGRPPTAADLIVPSHRLDAQGQHKHRHSTKTWE